MFQRLMVTLLIVKDWMVLVKKTGTVSPKFTKYEFYMNNM